MQNYLINDTIKHHSIIKRSMIRVTNGPTTQPSRKQTISVAFRCKIKFK